MGFNIKKISTSFDLTVQLTYITYKVHCKFTFLQKKSIPQNYTRMRQPAIL